MGLKIRMRRQGRTNRPFYRMVVCDTRSKRDGQYLEAVGWYNPVEKDAEKDLVVHPERIQHWLNHGAQLTESAEKLVKRKAPDLIKQETEKRVAHRAKMLAKKKERNKKAGAAK